MTATREDRATPAQPIRMPARLRPALPFAAVGAACVVCGGLVAAATAPAPSEHGSWAAAYLVLVAGVAQIALGTGRVLLAPTPASRRRVAAEFVAWNGGNAAVLAGTLAGAVAAVDAGSALLVLALALLAWDVREAWPGGGWWLRLYCLLIGLLSVSVPIGVVLARVT